MGSSKLTMGLVLLLLTIVTGYSAFEHGKSVQKKADEVLLANQKKMCEGEKTQMVLENQTAIDAANKKARDAEQDLAEQLNKNQTAKLAEKQNATKAISSINSYIYDGSLRLRVPTFKNNTGNELRTIQDSTTTGPSPDEDRTELLPETASALVRLAGECDSAVRERNEAVEIYETVRTKLNSIGSQNEN